MPPDTSGADWLEPMASLAATTHSFIVIIRQRPPQAGQPNSQITEWRGSVEHSQTHERIYFTDYARLNAFIAARSETIAHPPWRARLAFGWLLTGLQQLLRRLLGSPQRCAQQGKSGRAG